MNISQSCKSFRYYLAYNSPAAFCPASCSFSLCIYILNNTLKGPPCLSLKLFFCTAPACPGLSLTHSSCPALSKAHLCLFNPMNHLCSAKVFPTCAVIWKKVPRGRGSICDLELNSFASVLTFITVLHVPLSSTWKHCFIYFDF